MLPLLFAACNKEGKSGTDDSLFLSEIGARIENFTLKSVADPDGGKIRFEDGDRILLDNGKQNAVYVWNVSREAFVPENSAIKSAEIYTAAFPAELATGSTPGNLVLDAPKSINLDGYYIEDLPMMASSEDDILVFRAYSDVIGTKAHVQEGSGTRQDPYIVSCWEDIGTMIAKADEREEAFYRQTEDIVLPAAFRFRPVPMFSGEYDGGGHSISGLSFRNTSIDSPSGLFAVLDGATVKNLSLEEISFVSDQMYLGGIAGKALKSNIEGCSVNGYIKSTARFTWDGWESITTDAANHGFVGGIAGYAEESIIDDCRFAGQLSAMGKNTGGIAGFITKGTVIEGCMLPKGAEAYTSYHCVGGVAGVVAGGSSIKNCSSIAAVSALGYWVGGIAGYLQDGSIEACVTSSDAIVSGRQYNVGGIVGGVHPLDGDIVTLSRNICYADVQGQYSIGGIAGTIDTKAGSTVTVSDCAFVGGTLYATGTNSANYNLVGGICGWIRARDAVTVENCASAIAQIKASIQNAQKGSDNAKCIGAVAGLIGYKDQDGTATVRACWSSLDISRILVRYKAVGSSPDFIHYGSIYGGGGNALVLVGCYRDSDFAPYSRSEGISSGCTGISQASFTDGTLLAALGTGWEASASGYPLPAGLQADPSPRSSSAKRVSIIGDSISSFAGYIPAAYNYHYPNADGAVTQVSQTYWYRLIYDKLADAVLDLNMSYSGAAVTRSTDSSKSGNHWYDNCFIQRYIRQGGVGNPDIVLIHGGTNDWAHNDCPLYPGGDLCKNAAAPAANSFEAVFSTADAASGYEQACELPDTDFLSAYTKLVKMLQEQYPGVKIVCIIGDYLSEGVEQCILGIAEHYGAKTVNLLRVNGFNDQTYMPKHDFNGTSGCHPNAQAMEFIADKIYKELGSWLEN